MSEDQFIKVQVLKSENFWEPLYTFVEQVRRHGVDPFAYFEWVFEKLMHEPSEREFEALLPENWIKSQQGPTILKQSHAA